MVLCDDHPAKSPKKVNGLEPAERAGGRAAVLPLLRRKTTFLMRVGSAEARALRGETGGVHERRGLICSTALIGVHCPYDAGGCICMHVMAAQRAPLSFFGQAGDLVATEGGGGYTRCCYLSLDNLASQRTSKHPATPVPGSRPQLPQGGDLPGGCPGKVDTSTSRPLGSKCGLNGGASSTHPPVARDSPGNGDPEKKGGKPESHTLSSQKKDTLLRPRGCISLSHWHLCLCWRCSPGLARPSQLGSMPPVASADVGHESQDRQYQPAPPLRVRSGVPAKLL